jgi:hypothetical protein
MNDENRYLAFLLVQRAAPLCPSGTDKDNGPFAT